MCTQIHFIDVTDELLPTAACWYKVTDALSFSVLLLFCLYVFLLDKPESLICDNSWIYSTHRDFRLQISVIQQHCKVTLFLLLDFFVDFLEFRFKFSLTNCDSTAVRWCLLSVNQPPPPEPASPSHTASSALHFPSPLLPSCSSPPPSSSALPGESAPHFLLFAETPGQKRERQWWMKEARHPEEQKGQSIGESG